MQSTDVPPRNLQSPLAILAWHKGHTLGFQVPPLNAFNEFRARWIKDRMKVQGRAGSDFSSWTYFRKEYEKMPEHIKRAVEGA